MIKTRITEMLGIKYPILQGGMLWVSRAELVAAVSNAGGLGIMAAATFYTTKELKEELRRIKNLTDKPFAVNITLVPRPGARRPMTIEKYIDTVIEEGVDIVETAGRNPEPYMESFKQGNVRVIHKTTRLEHAEHAEQAGVTAVTIFGYDGGGHFGLEDGTSLIRIPVTVDRVKIPVIAAGGFADARGLVAALALGAEGVLMGTRFLATKECNVHPSIKQRLIEASERDTMIIGRSMQDALRVMKTKTAERVVGMEEWGARFAELYPILGRDAHRQVLLEGNLDAGILPCSQAVGLIHSIPTVKELIDEIVNGAESILGHINNVFGVKE